MKRKDLERKVQAIAKERGFIPTFEEGGNHTIVYFDGHVVTLIARHKEINEDTARGTIRRAEKWEKPS